MSRWYERYQQGLYQQVYDELVTMQEEVFEEPVSHKAVVIAQEMMRRVRTNIELLIPRLKALNYQFVDGYWVNYWEKRESPSNSLKLKLVRLMQSGDMPVARISRKYQVTRSLLYYWWQHYQERGEAAFAPTKEGLASPSVSRPQTPDEQVARLERLCGQQALEIDRLQSEVDLLKKAWHLLPFKSDTP